MKTYIINLISGPGSGKSTACAGIFNQLKKRGVECELALEYAKDCVWDESYKKMDDQVLIFGMQYHRIWRLNGKVQVVILDSPLLLSLIYNKNVKSEIFESFVLECFSHFNNIVYFIERNEVLEFNNNGRVHSREESLVIDQKVKNILEKFKIPYKSVKNNESVELITKEILEKLKEDK